jgi:hypothetical protein
MPAAGPGDACPRPARRGDTAHRLQVRGIARGDVIEALLEHLVSDERATSAVCERLARRLATS